MTVSAAPTSPPEIELPSGPLNEVVTEQADRQIVDLIEDIRRLGGGGEHTDPSQPRAIGSSGGDLRN